MTYKQDSVRIAENQPLYEELGHADRHEYLVSLADEHGFDIDVVVECAAILGPNEDFDGLVTMLDDVRDELDR